MKLSSHRSLAGGMMVDAVAELAVAGRAAEAVNRQRMVVPPLLPHRLGHPERVQGQLLLPCQAVQCMSEVQQIRRGVLELVARNPPVRRVSRLRHLRLLLQIHRCQVLTRLRGSGGAPILCLRRRLLPRSRVVR
ncbi:unnamed protein product [Scytosiphon promiscuus]